MGDRQAYERRRPPSLVGPVILITIGLLILLNNLDMLNVNLWELWRLWPVLLILAGLEIILGRRSVLGNLIVLALTLAVVAGIVILLVGAPHVLGPSISGGADRIVEPLDGIERAELRIDFAAGSLNITRLTDSSSLIEGDLDLAAETKPFWMVDRSDDRAAMSLGYESGTEFRSWRGGDEWELYLSPKVSFSLDVDVGAGGATLDLTGLDIDDLVVEAGASQTQVIFPAEGNFAAKINSGVGALVLTIPEGMAARLRISRGLGVLDISDRFRKDDQEYVTDDWATNGNRVDVKLDVGVGVVTVREP
jgi:hypothetical protein